MVKKIYYNIKDFFHKIHCIIRDIFLGITTIINYIPLLWADRDWDQQFLLLLVIFKIKRMRKYFESANIIVAKENNRIIKQLMICQNLLDRINKDEYCQYEYNQHNIKWGQTRYVFEDIGLNGFCRCTFPRKNVKNEADEQKETKEFRLIMDKEHQMKQQDVDLLLTIFKKHFFSWWD